MCAFIFLAVLAEVEGIVSEKIEPFQKTYPGQTLTFPDGTNTYLLDPYYTNECTTTIGTTLLILITNAFPLLVSWCIAAVKYSFTKSDCFSIHHPFYEDILSFALALAVAINLGGWLTTFIKAYSAVPRPCFYDLCDLSPDLDDLHCTNKIEDDGPWSSFPSNHATSFGSGLGILGLYLTGKFPTFITIWAIVFAWTIVFLSVTRVADYRHSPVDVVFGMMIGFSAAYLSYFTFYPSLKAENCGDPFTLQNKDTDGEQKVLIMTPTNSQYSYSDRE